MVTVTSDEHAREYAVIKTALMSIQINHKRNHLDSEGQISNFYSWCFTCLYQVNHDPKADELVEQMFDLIRKTE